MKRFFYFFMLLFSASFLFACSKPEKTGRDYYLSDSFKSEESDSLRVTKFDLTKDSMGCLLTPDVWETPLETVYISIDSKGNTLSSFSIKNDVFDEPDFAVLSNKKVVVLYLNKYLSLDVYDDAGNLLATDDTSLDHKIVAGAKLYAAESGRFIVKNRRSILLVDDELNVLKEVEVTKESKVVKGEAENLFLLYKDNGKDYIAKINQEDLSLEEVKECSISYDDMMVIDMGFDDYAFLYSDGDVLQGYNIERGLEEILSLVDSGIKAYGYPSAAYYYRNTEGKICRVYETSNYTRGDSLISSHAEIEVFSEREKKREVITVGAFGYYYELRQYRDEYNETNEDYLIRIINFYDEAYTNEETGDIDYSKIEPLFEKNLVDIVYYCEDEYGEWLLNENLLESIKTYINKDEALDGYELLENSINAEYGSLAINKKSKNKEASWKIIRELILSTQE